MDINGYNSSTSSSPNNTCYSNGPYMDSNSDSSVPSSPHVNQIMFGTSMPYEMYPYSITPATYYPTRKASKMSVDLSSNTSDEKDRRRTRSDASKHINEKEPNSNMHMRRRAQNRASQRAFRERKEKHMKGLEHQLEELHEKHQDLLQSYGKQIDEVSRLNARINELAAELNTVQHCQDSAFSELMINENFDKFDKFDAFSSTPMMGYHPQDNYYGKSTVGIDAEFALDSFEESL